VLQPPLSRCGELRLQGSPGAPLRGKGLAVGELAVAGIGAVMAWNLEVIQARASNQSKEVA
jgi:hypothetical protein